MLMIQYVKAPLEPGGAIYAPLPAFSSHDLVLLVLAGRAAFILSLVTVQTDVPAFAIACDLNDHARPADHPYCG